MKLYIDTVSYTHLDVYKRQQKYWQDWFIAHFPKGPTDPEYVLLKFRSEHATFWIDGQFVHRNI